MTRAAEVATVAARVFRDERAVVLATLIRQVGDFQLAEDAMQDAFESALVAWRRDGVPRNPGAWINVTARRRGIDRLRRERATADRAARLAELVRLDEQEHPTTSEATMIVDDRLRLIFTCCHPALDPSAQVALTLRTLGGLTTGEIAHAFLVTEPTMGKRIARAKRKIAVARIRYQVPADDELPRRLRGVLRVVYLIFNEGYSASFGDELTRGELCGEAIRLGRLLTELMPGEAEVRGLLALMLLHDARRDARRSAAGDPILLEEQDRTLWDQTRICEGIELAQAALRAGPGPYSVQAAIAAVHAQAARAEETDWPQIVALYDVLLRMQPSPVVELNRAAAVAMAEGCAAGLALLDELARRGDLGGYHLLASARADMLRRLGRWEPAAEAYREALAIAPSEADRRFLVRRLAEVETKSSEIELADRAIEKI